ncbi:RagB/SusD family nutrient uptake outer membrane protein [Pedobacter sp. MC2016-14]|uniref:RagB/SusD family nutrient uptake outer membrane protein n=1 Tax=Pedobacter sp. MC2016-14 TaxID=2897327 RepID=UPI001E5C2238|nr:RagB/SusD family nutrient uptake outer membrane protein [Pedobacter sp. MC2016-14]MCD0488588.1 RagB/SusD family nutrient uptake outer membrane protein [Pedobacter sp. MC2016-14]
MMNFRYKLGFACLAVSLLIASCKKDYLDTTPTNAISEEEALGSITAINNSLNGTYRAMYMQYSNQEQDGHPAVMIDLDYMGEDVVHTTRGSSYFRDTYRWVDHRTEAGDLPYFVWRMYYKLISNANRILAAVPNVQATADQRRMVVGEALAIRAYSHFQLVQLFARPFYKGASASINPQPGVPILTEFTLTPQPRGTVDEVYAQVNKDLDSAIFSLTGAPQPVNKTHININVAKGLKARVALTMGNWTDAAKYAAEARAGLSLMNNADYLSGFNDINNVEWMWGAHQLTDQLPTYGSFFAYMSANYNSVHTRSNPKVMNYALYEAINASDIRRKLWWDGQESTAKDFPGVIDVSTGLPSTTQVRAPKMHRKFMVKDPAVSVGDIPYMRVAEMYLIEAEAKAKGGSLSAAYAALLPLASNRDPEYAALVTSTSVAAIMIQRRIELWGEGFRFLDLKRTRTALTRNAATGANSSLTNWASVAVDDSKWQWAIPRREINANPLITQN